MNPFEVEQAYSNYFGNQLFKCPAKNPDGKIVKMPY